jgi:membrane protease YdiL (CAAX protease family)
MTKSLKLALAASGLALLITATMDATGYTVFSALPLIVLTFGFAWLAKVSPGELGFRTGNKRSYTAAFILPPLLLGVLSLASILLGADDSGSTDWRKSWTNIALMASTGIIMVAITEEGFFRGLLWALLERSGFSLRQTLMLTTALFVLWHLSAVLLKTEFAPPPALVPIFIINASLLGFIWGAMRQTSGSLWPPAIYHSVWNALAYELFGFGERTGALGVADTWLYGPETGLAGVCINTGVALFYLRKLQK